MENYWERRYKFFERTSKIRQDSRKFFFGNLFTDVFNSIYNQQIDQRSARNVIIGFFVVAGIITVIIAGVNTYKNYDFSKKNLETKKTKVEIKKDTKKPEPKKKKR